MSVCVFVWKLNLLWPQMQCIACVLQMINDTLHYVPYHDTMILVNTESNDSTMSTVESGLTGDFFTTAVRKHMSKIFLQTATAQGIAGAFAFASMIITCLQVRWKQF